MKAATRVSDGEGGTVTISIHAARAGGDLVHVCPKFGGVISIHAAREGGDDTKIDRLGVLSNFNPRRP